MSYLRHHAIIVTACDHNHILDANNAAMEYFFDTQVSDIVISPISRYYSFVVFTDGSKEGWDESDIGDSAREKLVSWLKSYKADYCPFSFAEFQYGDDNGDNKILQTDKD